MADITAGSVKSKKKKKISIFPIAVSYTHLTLPTN